MSEPMIKRPEHVPLAAIRTVAILVSVACVAGMVGALIVPTFLPDGWRAIGFTLAGMVVGLLTHPLVGHLRAPSIATRTFHADDLACDWLEQLAEFQVGRTDTTPDIRALFERGGVTRGHAHDVLRSLDRMRGEHYMDVYDAFTDQLDEHPDRADLLDEHPDRADLLDKAYRTMQGAQFEGRPIVGMAVSINKRTGEIVLSDPSDAPTIPGR